MKPGWRKVKLGDLLTPSEEWVQINPDESYREVTVKLWGKGVIPRGEVGGAEIASTRRKRTRVGQLILSKIDARNGALGMVPSSLDGAIVSNDFPVYHPNGGQVLPEYLGWLVKTSEFVNLCRQASEGTTNRVRLQEQKFLSFSIDLPPLSEQRQIVGRLTALAARINEAQALRRMSADEVEALAEQKRAQVFNSALKQSAARLEDVAVLERGKFSHRPRNEPFFFGGNHPWIQIAEIERANKFIRDWKETLNDEGLAISKKFPKGTVLVSIAATIGAVGILDFDCCVPDSIVGITPKDGTESEFLYHFLGFVRTHLEKIAPQSAQKNINLKILAALPTPRLSLAEQRRIVAELDALQARVERLKALQAESSMELNALMPSVVSLALRGD